MPPSPPTSPPAAKRAKLDAEPPATLSSPATANGQPKKETNVPSDSESEEEEEEVVPDEEEDLRHRDMYLDTVSRANLDFDFERLCSKSLSNINVYCCLVCGKYFQGRGKGSWAYRHAVGENHRVWLNLATEKFYVLPEGYLVNDPSLNDILHVLNPRFEAASLAGLSELRPPSLTLEKREYLPGYVGLNNIKANDYLNVITQMLLHVPPVRNFFLNPNTPQLQETARPTELVSRLAALTRRLWNPRLFKAQVSPHEFFHEVTKRSNGKFTTIEQGDPVEFLGWLINTLHRDLGGTRKRNSSVIYTTFQGKVQIETQKIITHKDYSRPVFEESRDIERVSSPFLFLALDLPATPLFQDSNEKKIIPQVSLASILAKFDGKTTQEFGPTLKRHHLLALPPYLILHIKRFTKNNFVEEKNPTIVNFPMRGVDMRPYVDPKPSDPIMACYDLLSNVVLESTMASTKASGKPDPSDDATVAWKIFQRAGRGGGESERWYEMQDLRVEDVRREMVPLGETVIQVWERRDLSTPPKQKA